MSANLRRLCVVVLGLLMAACDDRPTAPDLVFEAQPRGRTVQVDSLRMSLVGSTAEAIRSGTFRFVVTGEAQQVEPGVVIVGLQGGGFLRRVTAVTHKGNVLELATTEADLTDALGAGGSFTALVPIDLGRGAPAPVDARYTLGSVETMGLANGISLGNNGWSLNNVTLVDIPVCPAGQTTNCPRLRAGIQTGNMNLTAEFDMGAGVGLSGLNSAYLRVDGTATLNVVGFAEITAGSRSGTWQRSLGSTSRAFTTTAGGIKIAGKITTEVLAQVTLNVNSATRVTAGINSTTRASVGAQWTRGVGYQKITGVSAQATPQPLRVTNYPEATVKVTVTPRVTVSIYSIAGGDSYASIKPYVSAQVRGNPSRKVAPYTFGWGVDADASVSFKVFSRSLGTWNYSTNLYSRVLKTG
jgi:hypothetical protein